METPFIEFIDEGNEYPITLNFGPQHPATHGTLHMIVKLDGERIQSITPNCGYLHTGFEKLGEYRSYNQFITISDRMNYISPLNNNIGFSLAVEKMLGIDVPPRGKVVRILLAELSRLSDHLLAVGLMGLDTNAWQPLMRAFIAKEEIYDLIQFVTGTRLTTSYTRIGGVAYDLPKGFLKECREKLRVVRKTIKDFEGLFVKNRIFHDRMRGIGPISVDDAINWGLTGPVLRGCGVNYDIRKVRPYSGYEDFDFDIPLGEDGDSWSRFYVRMEEMWQALRIIDQAMENMPSGPVNVFNEKIVIPPKEKVYNEMESLIHHFKIFMHHHGFSPPEGEYYHSTEAPNGELGYFIVSNGKGNPYRVRVRPPSLLHFQAVKTLLKDGMVSDIPAVLSTLNVIAGELDR